MSAKRIKFTLPRDRVVVSLSGHAVEFKKGVPTEVPISMYEEVIAIGGVPETDLPEPEEPKKTEAPTDMHTREEAAMKAFEAIALRGRREDFTASGAPHPAVLARELGWTLHNKERETFWRKFASLQDA